MTVLNSSVWWHTLSTEDRRVLSESPRQPVFEQPDLLIIGGGIVGLAVAYFATERGLSTQIITTSSHLAEDANGSLGDIFPNASFEHLSAQAQPLAQTSRDWWAKLAVRPGFQIDWRVTGAVMTNEKLVAPDPRRKMLELLEEGYSVRDVDAEQIAILEPQLKAMPAGGLHFPSEANVHPLKAAVGFVRNVVQRGGRIATECTIQAVASEASGSTTFETSHGTIRPRFVVIDQASHFALAQSDQNTLQRVLREAVVLNSSGTSTTNVEGTLKLGSKGASRAKVGLFLATAPTTPVLGRPVLDDLWITQLKSGELVIGSTVSRESSSDSSETDQAELEQHDFNRIENRARELLPILATLPIQSKWYAPLESGEPHLPIIRRLPEVTNTWHYRDLFHSKLLFAPAIGRFLIDWIQSGTQPVELTPFGN